MYIMEYPTLEQIKSASPKQIQEWYDKLPLAGPKEADIMKQIIRRNREIRKSNPSNQSQSCPKLPQKL